MRRRTGRPHWIIFDEAHHLMPASWTPSAEMPELPGIVQVTVHPEAISAAVLRCIRGIIAVGENPAATIHQFSANAGWPQPSFIPRPEPGNVVAWFPGENIGPVSVKAISPKAETRRHKRKYGQGDLGDRSFYYRGPDGRLNLQAQNFAMFIQIGKGVDDDTWTHHLRRHDYSQWVHDSVKNDKLSAELFQIESLELAPAESRRRIFGAINELYTADEKNKP
jgi:hypothetical protein